MRHTSVSAQQHAPTGVGGGGGGAALFVLLKAFSGATFAKCGMRGVHSNAVIVVGAKAHGTRHKGKAQGCTRHKAQGTRERQKGKAKGKGKRVHAAQNTKHKAHGTRHTAHGTWVEAQGLTRQNTASKMEKSAMPSHRLGGTFFLKGWCGGGGTQQGQRPEELDLGIACYTHNLP